MDIDGKIKDAISNNDKKKIENYLNSVPIDHRFSDEDNDTILLYSLSDPLSNLYYYFLDCGANLSLVNDQNEGALHAIVFSGDIKRLDVILNNYNLNLNFQSQDGATPLLLAISLNEIEIATSLIKKGANTNISDLQGITPLHLAAQSSSDNVEFVNLLLLKGADPFLKTNNGNLAVSLAINGDNINIAKRLFDLMYNKN